MRRRALGAWVLFACVAGMSHSAGAQVSVTLRLPPDPFPVAPHLFAQAVGVDPSLGPVRMNLQISINNSFGLLVFNDTLPAPNDTTTFVVRRLLPQNSTLFFRVLLFDSTGRNFATTVIFAPRHTPAWLTLVSPNAVNGQTLTTSHPTFVWRSGHVDLPPGPWRYDLSIIPAFGPPAFFPFLSDTVFTDTTTALQLATSYRWTVKAYLVAGDPTDSIRVNSVSSFTILPTTSPQVLLLYQNFPNPFPTVTQPNTCIWFDLNRSGGAAGGGGNARLTVHTVHGDLVRTLVPGFAAGDTAGRYGRLTDSTSLVPVTQPCSLFWDGRSNDGRYVPPGVYLLVLRANGTTLVKKMLYRGH